MRPILKISKICIAYAFLDPQIQDEALNLCGCGGGRPIAPIVDPGIIIPPAAYSLGIAGRFMVRGA